MATPDNWEFPSLEWIHRVREAQYEKTKELPLESWLKPPDPEQVAAACRRLGLKIRLAQSPERKTVRR
ncbi:MAG: hypothetical protein ACRD1B_12090 [Thermoanaerobaculia bacterium]